MQSLVRNIFKKFIKDGRQQIKKKTLLYCDER